DRVLQQRLQEKHGHARDERALLHVDVDDQVVVEPQALDVEIIVEKAQLRLERNLVRLFIETPPQQRGESQQHPVSGVALRYESRDGVERVEEKVGPKL